MRVAVVGLGGVGGYIAASFVKAGIDTIGFARGEHLKEIQLHGITIKEDEKTWNARIDTREEDDLDGYFEGAFDVVMFCVKSYDLVDSFEHIRSHIDENTTLISFSNGVNNAQTLKDLSSCHVLDGCIYILSHLESPGVIRKKGKVFTGVFGGEKEPTAKLASLFEKAELRFKTPSDIKTAIWKKYIFISAFATLTSYYKNSIGYIYEYHRDEAEALLKEIAEFAKSQGVNIEDEVQKALKVASEVPYDSKTSMLKDFENKKRVELESLSGYVTTPLMSKYYEELKKSLK